MYVRSNPSLPFGTTRITGVSGPHPEMRMDFDALRLGRGDAVDNREDLERALLLVYGSVRLEWAGQSREISRANCFDMNPWVLHLPAGAAVTLTGVAEDSEVLYMATPNATPFAPRLYEPAECHSEDRGKGTLGETATRIVRTVFNHANAPYANLVVGEVVDPPGRWSSYPPHHHRQPEIYHYRFLPENGFGLCELGDDACKLHQNGTTLIDSGMTHSQTTAPGYAMWYLWVIRHLDGDPYVDPTFVPEHLWVNSPDAKIWPDA